MQRVEYFYLIWQNVADEGLLNTFPIIKIYTFQRNTLFNNFLNLINFS